VSSTGKLQNNLGSAIKLHVTDAHQC